MISAITTGSMGIVIGTFVFTRLLSKALLPFPVFFFDAFRTIRTIAALSRAVFFTLVSCHPFIHIIDPSFAGYSWFLDEYISDRPHCFTAPGRTFHVQAKTTGER